MDVQFTLFDVAFEWDAEKARANLEKHRVPFERAAEVFFDEYGLIESEDVDGEDRNVVAGASFYGEVLLVVSVQRTDVIRIVSARRATARERRRYVENRR